MQSRSLRFWCAIAAAGSILSMTCPVQADVTTAPADSTPSTTEQVAATPLSPSSVIHEESLVEAGSTANNPDLSIIAEAIDENDSASIAEKPASTRIPISSRIFPAASLNQ